MTFLPVTNVNAAIQDGHHVDAFRRLRTSTPFTLFESQLTTTQQDLLWETIVTGAGTTTYLQEQAALLLEVTNVGDEVIRQTYEYIRYQPGKSQLVLMTGVLGDSPNVVSNIGYGDDSNGLFFRNNQGTPELVIRSSATGAFQETVIPYDDWDETPEIDFTKTQIFVIDFEWLGVGRVRFGFDLGTEVVYVHESINQNIKEEVYMGTANLPARYDIKSISGVGTLKQICTSILSEGGYEQKGIIRSVDLDTTSKSVGTSFTPIISIRLNPNTPHAQILPEGVSIIQTSNNSTLLYKVMVNCELTGDSWQDIDSNSITQYDTSASNCSGGYQIDSDYIQPRVSGTVAVDFNNMPPLSSKYDGTPIILTIMAKTDSGTAPVFGGITFRELL